MDMGTQNSVIYSPIMITLIRFTVAALHFISVAMNNNGDPKTFFRVQIPMVTLMPKLLRSKLIVQAS